jgi:uncharacterized protein with gpF-like domain
MKPVIEGHFADIGIEMTFNVNDPRLMNIIAQKEIKIRNRVNQKAIREKVREELVTAAETNATTLELQASIQKKVGLVRSRSATIARTEMGSAANQLEHQSMLNERISKHQWVAALDEVTRTSHMENMQLGPWPINQPFPNGLRYPHDPMGDVSELVNCRCSAIPVE